MVWKRPYTRVCRTTRFVAPLLAGFYFVYRLNTLRDMQRVKKEWSRVREEETEAKLKVEAGRVRGGGARLGRERPPGRCSGAAARTPRARVSVLHTACTWA